MSTATDPEICVHGIPWGTACAVRCTCGHRCDAHAIPSWGLADCAAVGDDGAPCPCEDFAAAGGEG